MLKGYVVPLSVWTALRRVVRASDGLPDADMDAGSETRKYVCGDMVEVEVEELATAVSRGLWWVHNAFLLDMCSGSFRCFGLDEAWRWSSVIQ